MPPAALPLLPFQVHRGAPEPAAGSASAARGLLPPLRCVDPATVPYEPAAPHPSTATAFSRGAVLLGCFDLPLSARQMLQPHGATHSEGEAQRAAALRASATSAAHQRGVAPPPLGVAGGSGSNRPAAKCSYTFSGLAAVAEAVRSKDLPPGALQVGFRV